MYAKSRDDPKTIFRKKSINDYIGFADWQSNSKMRRTEVSPSVRY
jgi:hypothetical protein